MVMSPQVSWLFFKAVRAGLAVTKRPSRPIFALLLIWVSLDSVKMGRDAPSNASPARTVLPTAHFERNDIIIICETAH
jgi:hypothetical protein